MEKPTIILIGGPTASGKSALASDLAREKPCTIINADAMQIYAGLPVLTAQPEGGGELYGILDPAERSSAGKWMDLAKSAIQRSLDSGRTPVLVGGTGLYFKVLLEGLADIPDVPENVRAETQGLYEKLGSEAFRTELAKQDPASAARIKPNDRQRLVRAYEVVAHTGVPLGKWQDKNKVSGIGIMFHVERKVVLPDRETLYTACDARFEHMMVCGALDEVRTLLARNLDPDLPAMKILGVRELAAYLKGEISLDEAKEKAKQATRNYAKRQVTWFRNQWTSPELCIP